jgi:phosphate/sulfate permease
VALISGVVASVLAAAADKDDIGSLGRIRTALIVLPLIGAVASSLLAQTRVKELLGLRESGRETMQRLVS